MGGYHIPKNSLVICSPYAAHRNESIWKNPSKFDPDRFTPEKMKTLPKNAYIPFGAGRRKCIGAGMAMLEIPISVAAIVNKYKLRLVNQDFKLKLKPAITLNPDGPIPMKIERRMD